MKTRQRGAAILMALTTVALISTLASAVVWQQWRGWQIEQSERHATQLRWLLQGGMDWARLMLRIDAMSNATDHLGEPWAVPLQEARLSTFLTTQAAQQTQDLTDVTLEAFLSGRIDDAQGRLNARNLIKDSATGPVLSDPDVQDWQRLFVALGLNPERVRPFAEQWQRLLDPKQGLPGLGVQALPFASQWGALGLAAPELNRLAPYAVYLPQRTPLNLNTAPPVVLRAVLNDPAAEALLQWRDNSPLASTADVRTRWPALASRIDDQRHSVQSHHFVVHGQVRVEQVTQRVDMLVKREGILVNMLGWHPVPLLKGQP